VGYILIWRKLVAGSRAGELVDYRWSMVDGGWWMVDGGKGLSGYTCDDVLLHAGETATGRLESVGSV
jgi:hypothetical protein